MSEILTDEELIVLRATAAESAEEGADWDEYISALEHGLAANARIRELEKEIAVRDRAIAILHLNLTSLMADAFAFEIVKEALDKARAEMEGKDG